jgi:PPOX class probable F420-dependent enzyme
MGRMDRAEQARRVAGAAVGRLATLDDEGRPHLVPICFALSGDTIYSAVDQKPKRTTRLRRLENVRARPAATLLVDHYEDDWTQLWWVRLHGTGRVLDDGPERRRALALLASKYAQYRADPPAGAVLALDVREWSGWAARR